MTYWYPGIFEVIKIVKAASPSTPIVLGGIYATLCYEHARDKAGADYVIRGAGEIEILRLADSLSNKERDYRAIETWVEREILPDTLF